MAESKRVLITGAGGSDNSVKKRPKIGLIGCGAIAERFYLPALAKHPSVMQNLIPVDRERTRIEKLATQFDLKNGTVDYREILSEIDGAIIALPIELHHPVSMDFLSRGVDVLCEKPLAESADKGTEMVEQAQKAGAVLSVNYFQRLIPSFARVKELLANASLGEPLAIKYYVGEIFDWPTVSGFYFNSRNSARGILRDRGAHVIDHICWWLGGGPSLISSKNDSFGGSEAVAHIQFKHNNCFGEVKLSWLSSFPCRYIVQCQDGTIEGDIYDYLTCLLTLKSGKKRRLKSKGQAKLDLGDKIVTNFINVLNKEAEPLISGREVLQSLQFIDDCYRSATRFDMPWYDLSEHKNES